MGIVVIGDVFIDIKGFLHPLTSHTEEMPERSHRFTAELDVMLQNIANVELEPTFVSSVDDDAMGEDVIRKLDRHKVNTKI
ncbi:MAG: hypothetical protein ACLVI9_01580 [Anaerostipes hadrus]